MKKFFIIFFVIALMLSGCGRTKNSLKPQIKIITLNNLSNVSESAKEAYSELTNENILHPTDHVIIETTMGDYKIGEVLREQYPDLKLPSQDYTDIASGKSKVWIFVIYDAKGNERMLIKNGRNVKILSIRNNTFKKAGIAYDKCKDSTVIIKKAMEYFNYENVTITGIELVSSSYTDADSDFSFPLYGFRYTETKPQGTIFFSANNGIFVMAGGIWNKVTKP